MPVPVNPSRVMRLVFFSKIHCLRVVSSSVRLQRFVSSGASPKSMQGCGGRGWELWDAAGELAIAGQILRLLRLSLTETVSPTPTKKEMLFLFLDKLTDFKMGNKLDLVIFSPNWSDSSCQRFEPTFLT